MRSPDRRLPHGAVTNLEGDVHIAALAFDVVGIEGLGIAPSEDAALAARLTIVQASPSVDDIGLALFAGGGVYTGWWHRGFRLDDGDLGGGLLLEFVIIYNTKLLISFFWRNISVYKYDVKVVSTLSKLCT